VTITVEGVSHFFRSRPRGADVRVIDAVSFDVKSGSFLSVLGPSGCGKTTLLRIIHGLVMPSEGRVSVGGTPVTGPKQSRATVFQDFRLFPWRTVLRNVEFGPELRGVARAEREAKAKALLRLVGLEGYEHHYAHELSGGMKQRVALARALAVDPEVLLMDEPFGALDAQTREVMQSELLRIWEAHRVSVVFITHSIDEAVFLSDRVLVMSSRPGRVKADITIDLPRPRLAEDVRHSTAFLEYRRRIWASLATEITVDGG
jgi:NitT/TauT family transport system ATP-binding protein